MEVTMRSAAVALLAVAALSVSPAAVQDPAPSREQTKPFVQAGNIHLDLSVGHYVIQAGDSASIRVAFTTRRPRDLKEVWTDIQTNGSNATVRTRGFKNGTRVRIDVPRRSDLDMTLTAGDLTVRGIEGNKRLSMWAGDVTMEVGDVELYRRVDASVKAGEISPRPFGRSTGGLFRSFRWDGKGKYTIDATLFAGDLKLVPGDVKPR
jgi:hypothetical protein